MKKKLARRSRDTIMESVRTVARTTVSRHRSQSVVCQFDGSVLGVGEHRLERGRAVGHNPSPFSRSTASNVFSSNRATFRRR